MNEEVNDGIVAWDEETSGNVQQQRKRTTANRPFRKPEVKGSSPFAGSIESRF
jgi:hypothetical protein